MSEVITFNALLQRMLDRVPDTVDKREGSIIYDALAPAAAELVQAYIELEGYLDLVFVDTSAKNYLTRLCSQFGVDRQSATYAVRKGSFKDGKNNPFNVPIGSRYTIDTLSYSVIEKIVEGAFQLKCETPGTIGNTSFGKLIPIDYIEGLASAALEDVLIPGEEEETDEQLKERYFEYVRNPAYGGNIADYKRKVKALEGVGQVKVFPVWNGGGTVKLIIVDSDNNIPSPELVNAVQTVVDPIQNSGEGLGIAPIGHVVTVKAASALVINVKSKITLQSGYVYDDIKDELEDAISDYLLGLREQWGNTTVIVRPSYIDARLLSLDCVLDVENTTINDAPGNVTLGEEQIPIFGELEVVS